MRDRSSVDALPSGVVTILFTDVEGSVRLWELDERDADRTMQRHDGAIVDAVLAHNGHVFSMAGDSFAVAFASARDAVDAAVDAQLTLVPIGVRVRMGLHAGEVQERDGNYFGATVNRAARLMAAGHGGQILLSGAVAELVRDRISLRDLGGHDLRDVSARVSVWQVRAPGLAESFPPLRSLTPDRSSLPRPTTPLVGRQDEVDILAEALRRAEIITVTGPGGMGKTRLAIEAATRLGPEFPDGVRMADLSPVDAPDAVAEVVLDAMSGRRQEARTALETIAELASTRRMLVVLDNCEHVLDEAAACAQAIVAGGAATVLATSREPLRLAAEQLLPLAVMDEGDAVDLFMERARAVDPTFWLATREMAVLRTLCAQLDCLPLAIELAAARMRSMTVGEVLDHVDERLRFLRAGTRGVSRHRTLHAAVKWSFDLLDPRTRRLFVELAVFAGHFDLRDVVGVCSDVVAGDVGALDLLEDLIARSMVVAARMGSTTRYSLLETIRRFAYEQLDADSGVEHRRDQHAEYFVTFAEQMRRRLSTEDGSAAAVAFDAAWDNLRAALQWSVDRQATDAALRLVVACTWHAGLTHRYELLDWCEQATSCDGAEQHDLWPAAIATRALLEWGIGSTARAHELARESWLAETARDTPRRFEPVMSLAITSLYMGNDSQFVEMLPTAEDLARESGDPIELAVVNAYRILQYLPGRIDAPTPSRGTSNDDAHSIAEATLADAQASGCPHQLAFAHLGLLASFATAGRREDALEAYRITCRWAEVAGNKRVLDNAPLWLALAYDEAEPVEVLLLLRGALTSYVETGYWGILDFALSDLLEPLLSLRRDRGAALTLGAMRTSDSEQIAHATTILRERLGVDFDELRARGAGMPKAVLVRELLDEIDHCLPVARSEA
jgi:predicted ATPase/class 3 adenylate cyclase